MSAVAFASTLHDWLRARFDGFEDAPRIVPVAGGQSNPTFFVDGATRRLVLRKRPPGTLAPSAHAVDREYRVLAALADTGVPVPKVLAYCDDPSVTGTAFYLMERIDGRVFGDCAMPDTPPADRRAMFLSMATTLAKLHRVDWAAVGLTGYGKPERFLARQVERWTARWRAQKTRDDPNVERLVAWLPAHLPADEATAIAHGDYRVGNLIFHPTEPRVAGILDWELSTLGEPLADLAFSALAWRLGSDEHMGMGDRDLDALGIPREADYLAAYYAEMGDGRRATNFHFAFALFRLAVIFEGITARALDGSANDPDALRIGAHGATFARRGVEAL